MDSTGVAEGINTFIADFVTDHRLVRADLFSGEARLSDHLNSSSTTVDVSPAYVAKITGGAQIDLAGTVGRLNKAHLLLVVPVKEPVRTQGSDKVAWKWTMTRRCWMGVGPFRLVGTIYTESGRDPHLALRMLDRQFLPVIGATVTFPDGETRDYPAIIVSRDHMDLLAIGTTP